MSALRYLLAPSTSSNTAHWPRGKHSTAITDAWPSPASRWPNQFEGYYASVFYASFAALGLEIVPEDVSNQGRLDMAVKFNGQVYLFEFKVVEEDAEGRALRQIREKRYADKYRALDQRNQREMRQSRPNPQACPRLLHRPRRAGCLWITPRA